LQHLKRIGAKEGRISSEITYFSCDFMPSPSSTWI